MNFTDLMSFPSMWDSLSAESRPIFMYGTGNGGDKIIYVLEKCGISLAGVFASDGFVRSREFHGMKVKSYSEVRNEYGDGIVILCAFGSPREDVLSFLAELDSRHTLYLPDVPLFCENLSDELFTPEYALSHRSEIEETAGLFADGYSRELFYEILAYRISGKMKYLSRTEAYEDSVKNLVPSEVSRIIDGGAFNGDTARIFLRNLDVSEMAAIEPDLRTYRKLDSFLTEENNIRFGGENRLHSVNALLGDDVGVTEFMSSASRGSAADSINRRAKITEIAVTTVDSEVQKLSAHGRLLLKLDVEGAEYASLLGAKNTLIREKPVLSVSLYHRTADIFRLPKMISEMCGGYRFYLRRVKCVPAWEITLFAV